MHEISNNVVRATGKGSDQPAHRRSLISLCSSLEFSMSVKLLTKHLLEVLSLNVYANEAAEARLSLHLSKCNIVGNHMSWLKSFSHSRHDKGKNCKVILIFKCKSSSDPMLCTGALKSTEMG